MEAWERLGTHFGPKRAQSSKKVAKVTSWTPPPGTMGEAKSGEKSDLEALFDHFLDVSFRDSVFSSILDDFRLRK